MIYFDGVILAHCNEAEWNKFKAEHTNEAILDRIVRVNVPYTLEFEQEVKIYKKLIDRSDFTSHIAPHTLEVAAMFAVLSRLKPSNKVDALTKMKIYNGEEIVEKGLIKKVDIKDLREEVEDEGMTGKIRVSIVATALDGFKNEGKTVLNMVSRIQNRNTGYSENLFSHNPRMENNTLNSIDGATAFKLDDTYLLKEEEEQNSSIGSVENNLENQEFNISHRSAKQQASEKIPAGVSIESASYIENNNLDEHESDESLSIDKYEHTPKLFSENLNSHSEEINNEIAEEDKVESEHLFDQELKEEEDFEIPAFLRKQKF